MAPRAIYLQNGRCSRIITGCLVQARRSLAESVNPRCDWITAVFLEANPNQHG